MDAATQLLLGRWGPVRWSREARANSRITRERSLVRAQPRLLLPRQIDLASLHAEAGYDRFESSVGLGKIVITLGLCIPAVGCRGRADLT